MQFGVVIPGGSAQTQLDLAVAAERRGWDGVFVWEDVYGVEAWTLLGAIAASTERIRLGTMLTPLPWRRPWIVASQVATLDDLSGGRAILTVGLGATDAALGLVGETTDLAERADLLDEKLDIIKMLWADGLAHEGKYHQIDLTNRVLPRMVAPVQTPPPIWVVGAWPRPKSMHRVLQCDGIVPQVRGTDGHRAVEPADVSAMKAWLVGHNRGGTEIVVEGTTSSTDGSAAQSVVQPFQAAGATWWIEARWSDGSNIEETLTDLAARIDAGPPGV